MGEKARGWHTPALTRHRVWFTQSHCLPRSLTGAFPYPTTHPSTITLHVTITQWPFLGDAVELGITSDLSRLMFSR